jgi:WD40 repeat protein
LPTLLVSLTIYARRTFAQMQGCVHIANWDLNLIIDLNSGRSVPYRHVAEVDTNGHSPDGAYKVRAEPSLPVAKLYMVNLADSSERLITERANYILWSPDSRWLLYSDVDYEKGETTLTVMRPDFSDQHSLLLSGLADYASAVTWTRDSQHIIVAYMNIETGIVNYDWLDVLTLQGETLFTAQGMFEQEYVWSPSGESFVVVRIGEPVRLYHLSDRRLIEFPVSNYYGAAVRVRFSPGGEYLFASYANSDWTAALNIFDMDGNAVFPEFVVDVVWDSFEPMLGWVDDHRLVVGEWNTPLGRPDLVALDLTTSERRMLTEGAWSWEVTDAGKHLVVLPMNNPEGEFTILSTSDYTPESVVYYSKAYELVGLDIANDARSLIMYNGVVLRVMDATTGEFIHELPLNMDGVRMFEWFACREIAQRVRRNI